MTPTPAPNVGPLDRWTLADGTTCWTTTDKCPDCGEVMATNGRAEWCPAGCAGVSESL